MRMITVRLCIISIGCLLIMVACGGAPQVVGDATPEVDAPSDVDVTSDEPSETQILEEDSPVSPINLAGPELGTTMQWVDGGLLVYVPPGKFVMGDGGDDRPIHTVNLGAFWIYRAEVTNAMYLRCMVAGACSSPAVDPALSEDISLPELADKPVVGVNWEQSEAYCQFVEGHLPSEAQWEKTARGPNGNIYPWGDTEPTCELLNYNNCVGKMSEVWNYPTGRSYYDALDMAGNVFEWVADFYDPNYYGNEAVEDPLGPETGQMRSVRGSTFKSATDQIPSALRFFNSPEKYRTDLGFRCVVESPDFYAPFCELPGFRNPNTPPPETCAPPDVDILSNYCRSTTGHVTFDAIGDVDTIDFDGFDCDDAGNDRYVCYGAGGATGSVTICSDCEQNELQIQPQLQPSDTGTASCLLTCPPGYLLNSETCKCKWVLGEMLIEDLPESGGNSDGPSPEGDTNGFQPVFPPPEFINVVEGFLCQPGMYYDQLHGGCVPVKLADPLRRLDDCFPRRADVSEIPEVCQNCPQGYGYNPEMGCCGVVGGTSPVCDGYIDEAGRCRPLMQIQDSCTTVSLSLPECERSSGGEPGDPGGCINPAGCTDSSRCGRPGVPPCCCP